MIIRGEMMTKAELRAKYLEVRKGVVDREAKDGAGIERVIRDAAVKRADTVLLYASYRGEVDTWRLIEYLLVSQKKVALPRVEGENLTFYMINGLYELEKGKFGILAPKGDKDDVFGFKNGKNRVLGPKNDPKIGQYGKIVCLVPGVCFNQNGYRVGYGSGFYDRFLKEMRQNAKKLACKGENSKCAECFCAIGLCYKECITEVEFQEAFDQKVDRVITD